MDVNPSIYWRTVALEMSLKPFGDPSEANVRATVRRMFEQWLPLCRHAEAVQVLLWAADGSEILDYRGELDDTFEWAYLVGGANPRLTNPRDPEGIGLHSRSYLYMENPPKLTYRWLRQLVTILKEVGGEVTGRPVRVGATFDPGPEFAISSFKYERHNEICTSGTMGRGSFVCCYTTLAADDVAYAGFPDGIPEGTPIGAFLGRQARCFAADLGFDYLWLSNGFGFGLETWALRGAVFDGRSFSAARCEEVKTKILGFWDAFRRECPDLPLETRGTNLSTAMDLSSDAVPLREIYRGGYGLLPPPNSPWAAINGDFGLELVGWMSKIAELPGSRYPFRFYTHDPWWNNSPWIDRYGREPHDIHLPLAVSRLTTDGEVQRPTSVHFLTVDDSWGRMPDLVPREVSTHVLGDWETGPDAPGPLVWLYPFDEYHDWTYGRPSRIEEVFFGDWFMRGAVNHGLPLNTVVSTRVFEKVLRERPERLAEAILVSPVPEAASGWSEQLLKWLASGGRTLLYGPVQKADERWLEALGLDLAEPIDGELQLTLEPPTDLFTPPPTGRTLLHPPLFSAGGVEAIEAREDPQRRVLAAVEQAGVRRVAAVTRAVPEWGGGRVTWVRGTVACDPEQVGGHLLVPYPPERSFPGEALMRLALASFGLELLYEYHGETPPPTPALPASASPLVVISRHRNGFFFAGYTPRTTVVQHFRLPQGAPLLNGYETKLVDGRATYHLPRAWRRECRAFVEQESGEVGCREQSFSEQYHLRRRMLVTGLRDAVLRFYHEPGTEDRLTMLRDPRPPYIIGDFATFEHRHDALGDYLELRGASGDVMLSW